MTRPHSAAIIGTCMAALMAVTGVVGVSPASAAGPSAFTLHLVCDNGQSYDISINTDKSVAALVDGSTMVAVLKNGNGTVVPAFADSGPLAGTLVTCDTGIPGFTAQVLFTPTSLR